MKLLSVCPRLQTLYAYESNITDAFIEQLLEKAPGLRIVAIAACEALSERGLMSLAGLKDIRWLDLFDTNTTDAVLKRLYGASRLAYPAIGSNIKGVL